MSFNGLVSSGIKNAATRSASGLVGIGEARAQLQNSLWTAVQQARTRGDDQLAERTRIAAELHDTLLQGFFAVSMQLQAAIDDLPVDSRSRFSHLVQLMERVLEQGRLAIQGLRSPYPDGRSLGQALARIPDELGLSSGVRFQVVVEGRQRELTAPLRDEIYRIGREAVVNAYRHSRAEEIEIELEYRPTELRMIVRDTGCGMDSLQIQHGRHGHWGLHGMRERAERIGARLRILSRITLGTEVELSLPGAIAFEPDTGPPGFLKWAGAFAGIGRD